MRERGRASEGKCGEPSLSLRLRCGYPQHPFCSPPRSRVISFRGCRTIWETGRGVAVTQFVAHIYWVGYWHPSPLQYPPSLYPKSPLSFTYKKSMVLASWVADHAPWSVLSLPSPSTFSGDSCGHLEAYFHNHAVEVGHSSHTAELDNWALKRLQVVQFYSRSC